MPNREIHNSVYPVVALNTQAITSDTTTNGNIIDTQGCDALEFLIQTGGFTDGDFTPLIREGDAANLSDASDVADADLTVTEASVAFTDNGDDHKVRRIGYTGSKRYVKLSIVSTNVSSGATIGAIALKGLLDVQPAPANA